MKEVNYYILNTAKGTTTIDDDNRILREDAANDKNINSICYNCRRYKGECCGTSEQAYTGCIYREVR